MKVAPQFYNLAFSVCATFFWEQIQILPSITSILIFVYITATRSGCKNFMVLRVVIRKVAGDLPIPFEEVDIFSPYQRRILSLISSFYYSKATTCPSQDVSQ